MNPSKQTTKELQNDFRPSNENQSGGGVMNLNKFVEEAIETVMTSITADTCYANVCYAQGRLASYLELNAITIEEFIDASNKITKAYSDYLDKNISNKG